jgi:predicted transcriptional regulator
MSNELKPFTDLTAKIAAAFVGKNSIPHAELGPLIRTIHNALKRTVEPEVEAVEASVKKTAAQIRKSVTPDVLISFLDGKSYKTLKRHLTTNGLTVADYKTKFGLPKDYPTTAPSYSARRSAMAKALGLGQGGRKATAPVEAVTKAPVRRGGTKKRT